MAELTVEGPLTNITVLVGLSSLDVKNFLIGESANVVGFPSPRTLADRTDLEIIALKMTKLRSDKTTIPSILFINPQCLIRLMINEEILVVDLDNFEGLCRFVSVIVEDKLAIVRIYCEDLFWV